MENTAIDYKKLYEESLLALAEKEEETLLALAEKEEAHLKVVGVKDAQISQLSFELDKFRRYLFGSKSEKLPVREVDLSQIAYSHPC